MATPGVGQDIEDTCGKCGDTWHVVAAKVGDRVIKVVCKLCGTQHNYHNGRTAGTAGSGTRTVRKRGTATPQQPDAPPAFDPTRPPRNYSARDGYQPGDRINHPKFGLGVVAASAGPGKVDVVFPAGVRVLACAKESANLQRPTPVEVPISDRPPDQG